MASAARTASTLDPSPFPYPPKPDQHAETDSDTDTDGHIESRTDVEVFVEVDDLDRNRYWRRGGCSGGACGEKSGAELPMTGAPVQTLAAIGAGMLFLGASGTMIAVRRRRSSSAS
ncbi:hypothetical protein GCM10012289_17720 [Nonomuraea cavernae]|uniref:Gram-positive cocci surface proteins LPxTG domain-containing protein n=2 Tax=Nonomuraea cavernae TaxID=2045107 RepID=A0A917YT61_9ACTN|nr:hypothetical protein GCM10012289_17720 [Nonomuraea cavernae]